jgi:hypothetical protein
VYLDKDSLGCSIYPKCFLFLSLFLICFFFPFYVFSLLARTMAVSIFSAASQYHGWVFPVLPDLQQKLSTKALVITMADCHCRDIGIWSQKSVCDR